MPKIHDGFCYSTINTNNGKCLNGMLVIAIIPLLFINGKYLNTMLVITVIPLLL